MDEHLTTERLSRLLDEPGTDADATEHLEGCRACSRELEGLRRMRMALSGIGEEGPPTDEWSRIEAELEEAGQHSWALGGSSWYGGWPARAAAAMLVFGVGVAAGLQFDFGGEGALVEASGDRPAVEEASGAADPSFEAGFGGLLTSSGVQESVSAVEDPVTAAEELARLDALARAVRERLRENPADPELNDLLFQIADRQESLTREFGQAAQLVSLDYR